MKGVGAAATTAAVGGASVGTAAAQTDDDVYDTLQNTATEWAFGSDPKKNMAVMMMTGGVMTGPVVAEGLAPEKSEEAVSMIADWIGGHWDSVNDGDAEQMELSSYYHLRDMRDSHMMLLEQLDNQAELITNNAISVGVHEIAKGIQAGDRKSAALSSAQTEALDMLSRIERDMLKVIESLIMRTVNLRDRQAIVFGDRPDYDITIRFFFDESFHGNMWTEKVTYTLMNGDEIETRALRVGVSSDNWTSVVAHPLLSDAEVAGVTGDTLASRTDRYSEWSSDGGVYVDDDLFNNINHSNSTPHDSHVVVEPPDTADSGQVEVFKLPETLAGGDDPRFHGFFNAQVRDRADTIMSEIGTIAEDAYNAYNSGDLAAAKDLITPFVRSENLAMEWQDTGHFGVASGFAQNLGYSTSLKAEMDVTIFTPDGSGGFNSEQKTGNLLADDDAWAEQIAANDDSVTVEEAKPVEFSVDVRRPVPTGSNMGVSTYLATGEGLQAIDGSGQEIRVDRILDADGVEQSSVSTTSTDMNDIDISQLEDRLAERLDSQQELTVDIQGGGGGGGGNDDGGWFDLSDRQIFGGVAGAGIAAYLLGKGGKGAASLHPVTR